MRLKSWIGEHGVKSKAKFVSSGRFCVPVEREFDHSYFVGEYPNNGSNSFCTMENKLCAYCGKIFSGEGWPHVEGDSNRGVLKIEQFCSEEHKYNFLNSEL